ncbi:MAG: addiction module protein [Longimicrobiales bacterium]|nr:addiction module protein [Longimicrobiales bacterium]
MSIEELEIAAMQLPPDERERLGEKLLSSVDTPLEFEDEWAEEADRRIEEMLNGTVKPVPGDEVLRAALKRLN